LDDHSGLIDSVLRGAAGFPGACPAMLLAAGAAACRAAPLRAGAAAPALLSRTPGARPALARIPVSGPGLARTGFPPRAGLAAAGARRGLSGWARASSGPSPDQILWGLIGANVGVFALWKTANPFFMYQHFTCSPEGLAVHHRFHTLITCVFSHESIWHLGANMLGLYFFGGELVALLGARTFLSMYFGAGVLSSAAQVFDSYRKRIRTVLLGASGAVNACIAYSILMWPRRVVLVYGIFPLPAAIFGVFIMFQDVWGAASEVPYIRRNHVGYVAHITGAGVGAAVWAATRGRISPFRRF